MRREERREEQRGAERSREEQRGAERSREKRGRREERKCYGEATGNVSARVRKVYGK